jgi:hypothetical protein
MMKPGHLPAQFVVLNSAVLLSHEDFGGDSGMIIVAVTDSYQTGISVPHLVHNPVTLAVSFYRQLEVYLQLILYRAKQWSLLLWKAAVA